MERQRHSVVWALLVGLVLVVGAAGCGGAEDGPAEGGSGAGGDRVGIIFLHHSTGGVIWDGGVEAWFDDYNAEHGTGYRISERAFPGDGYPWDNYPYDYWNIWVQHAGERRYKRQDTLEILTGEYEVIVWKHCFPVSYVEPDLGSPDVASDYKSIENYRVQYQALKEKMHQFPETQFIVWTGAALTAGSSDGESARRAGAFFDWVRQEWDEPGDNIYLWDFWQLETEGGFYLRDEYAAAPDDSHPNEAFAARVAPFFARRIVDVIEGRGDTGSLAGE